MIPPLYPTIPDRALSTAQKVARSKPMPLTLQFRLTTQPLKTLQLQRERLAQAER